MKHKRAQKGEGRSTLTVSIRVTEDYLRVAKMLATYLNMDIGEMMAVALDGAFGNQIEQLSNSLKTQSYRVPSVDEIQQSMKERIDASTTK